MRITVLGKSPSWQDAGGACSGYLVEEGAVRVLVDCGSGVFAQLRRVSDYVDVDAILVSHMHGDHFLDLVPFACALLYAPRQQPVPVAGWPGTDHPSRPRLLVPPDASAALRSIGAAGGQPRLFDRAFDLREYDVCETVDLGGLSARFQPVPHYIATNAIELCSDETGARFTYGADHRPNEEIVASPRASAGRSAPRRRRSRRWAGGRRRR